MAEPTKSPPPPEDEVIWIYNLPKYKNRAYEFHPKLQNHIEKSFQIGKHSCKLNIFGLTWIVDFKKMVKIRENGKDDRLQGTIKRILKKDAAKHEVLGISGIPYDDTPEPTFQQTNPTCDICLYPFTLPTRIDTCGHVFCYMCLKNNYTMGMECPTCRARIPAKIFEVTISNDLDIHIECPEEYSEDCRSMFDMAPEHKGALVAKRPLRRSQRSTRLKYYWVYESKVSGWYRYDPKNERYIEEAYVRKKKNCTLFICGYKITVYINERYQERITNGLTHTRKIKRILSTEIEKYGVKGIAGIRGYVRALE